MAENQQGRQTQATLQTIPGWELRSPGSKVAAAKAAAKARAETPPAVQSTTKTAPTPVKPPATPQPKVTPLKAQPIPAQPVKPAAATKAPEIKAEVKPVTVSTLTRLKDFFGKFSLPAMPSLPSLKLPQINWPSSESLKMPTLKVPRIALPTLELSRKQRWMLGGAAAIAGASLLAVFTQTIQPRQENGPLADNTEAVTAPTPAAGAPDPLISAPTAPAAELKPVAPKLFKIETLPNTAALSDKEVTRLAASSKIPQDVVAQALHIYKHVSPENYQPRPTDNIELLYTKGNDILLARIKTGDTTRDIYGFEDAGGDYGFYTENGRRIDGSPLTSPVEGVLLSGYKPRRGFGTHFHPIHKRNKFHDGVDIPAPRGTPVYATSDGIIQKKGRQSGYGETIVLNHAHNMQSVYAHLNAYAKIPVGTRVKQGELIGYVGKTGWATGSHLHFEIRRGGQSVDPLKVASFSSMTLEGRDRPAFKDAVTRIKQYLGGDAAVVQAPKPEAAPEAKKSTPVAREAFTRNSQFQFADPITTASVNQGLHPDLLQRLFFKESGVDARGFLKVNARSDRGAEGLCQFTEEQFRSTMKRHGPQLGFAQYARMIAPQIKDGNTHYLAGDKTSTILNLRNKPEVAIPLCAAHVREDLDYLKAEIGREPTFTDSSIAHFMGRGAAGNFLKAYYNPRTRNQPAYKFVQPVNYEGPTNMNVFFENGNPKKPYSVAEVYSHKRRVMGDTPALSSSDVKLASTATLTP